MKKFLFALISMLFMVALLASLGVWTPAAEAVIFHSGGFTGTLDSDSDDDGVCDDEYEPLFAYTVTGTVDDTGGADYDLYALVFFDAYGNVIEVDIDDVAVGATITDDEDVDIGTGEFYELQARPITGVFFDVVGLPPAVGENTIAMYNWVLANGTALFEDYIDPTIVGSSGACGDRPLISPFRFIIKSQPAPQIGMIQINATSSVFVYDSPAGERVKLDGMELALPHDADHNGFDTYLVINSVEIDGISWLAIFVGDGDGLVWVRASEVIDITP